MTGRTQAAVATTRGSHAALLETVGVAVGRLGLPSAAHRDAGSGSSRGTGSRSMMEESDVLPRWCRDDGGPAARLVGRLDGRKTFP